MNMNNVEAYNVHNYNYTATRPYTGNANNI